METRRIAVALLLCACLVDRGPAQDPRAGTRLEYRLALDDVAKVLDRDKQPTPETLLATTMEHVRRRVPRATVTATKELGFQVDVAGLEADGVEPLRRQIEMRGHLEMRIVADAGYRDAKVTFDLGAERSRLEAWLEAGGRAALANDLAAIRRFNEDAKNGPSACGHLAWYVHKITPGSDGSWTVPFADDPRLGPSTVRVHDEAQWNGGRPTAGMLEKDVRDRYLIELVALNMREMFFRGEDLDPDGLQAIGADGSPAVGYSIRADRAIAYADWSEKYLGKCCAVVLDGVVESAPCFMSRITGRGVIQGNFTAAEVDRLVAVLRDGPLPVRIEFRGVRPIDPPK
jgi:hypothetical protein